MLKNYPFISSKVGYDFPENSLFKFLSFFFFFKKKHVKISNMYTQQSTHVYIQAMWKFVIGRDKKPSSTVPINIILKTKLCCVLFPLLILLSCLLHFPSASASSMAPTVSRDTLNPKVLFFLFLLFWFGFICWALYVQFALFLFVSSPFIIVYSLEMDLVVLYLFAIFFFNLFLAIGYSSFCLPFGFIHSFVVFYLPIYTHTHARTENACADLNVYAHPVEVGVSVRSALLFLKQKSFFF